MIEFDELNGKVEEILITKRVFFKIKHKEKEFKVEYEIKEIDYMKCGVKWFLLSSDEKGFENILRIIEGTIESRPILDFAKKVVLDYLNEEVH